MITDAVESANDDPRTHNSPLSTVRGGPRGAPKPERAPKTRQNTRRARQAIWHAICSFRGKARETREDLNGRRDSCIRSATHLNANMRRGSRAPIARESEAKAEARTPKGGKAGQKGAGEGRGRKAGEGWELLGPRQLRV